MGSDKCPICKKDVYAAEKKTHGGHSYHPACFKCAECGKTLTQGKASDHEGKLYCSHPCYKDLFATKGYGHGGAVESNPDRHGKKDKKDKGKKDKHDDEPPENCANCGKPVFAAEKKVAMDRVWHDKCLRCKRCNKVLQQNRVSPHHGEPFCSGCHKAEDTFYHDRKKGQH